MSFEEWQKLINGSICRVTADGRLVHDGLPLGWAIGVWGFVFIIFVWGIFSSQKIEQSAGGAYLSAAGFASYSNGTNFFGLANAISDKLGALWIKPWVMMPIKIAVVLLFLLVIWAGLAGSAIAGRNVATVLTWNLWWSGVIISVLFVGSGWCAICPWDNLANMVMRLRFWRGGGHTNPIVPSLGIRVPKYLRNVWPALFLFVFLTWLELGVGITTSPHATAILALSILVLAIIFLAIFERKAFCQFACPVGRTIGFYAQLAPVELRPRKADICAGCRTLECYHGNEDVDGCPTYLVMGRLKQNTFCTSCGNCARSCPHDNVGWRFRHPSHEALEGARPHWDEAWFMIFLLALTGFHGITMLEEWESWMRQLARYIGDSGQLLTSFSLAMIVAISVPIALFGLAVWMTKYLLGAGFSFSKIFMRLSFVALPLAFAYHLAHNLSHLLREGTGSIDVFANPLGTGLLPISVNERHLQMLDVAIGPNVLAAIQAVFLMAGFLVAILVIRRRGEGLLASDSRQMAPLAPIFCYSVLMTIFHLWLLMQPMNMRI